MGQPVCDYIIRLINATRNHPLILQGGSPRATLAVAAMGKAMAFVLGRDYVIPEDIQRVFQDTVAHRLILSPRAESAQAVDPLREILKAIPAPQIR